MTKLKELLNAIENTKNEWVRASAIRDICYSMNQNSAYQDQVDDECAADAREILENGYDGSEVDDSKLFALEQKRDRAIDIQKPLFNALYDLGCAAYQEQTGQAYKPYAQKTKVSTKAKTAAAEGWIKRLI